MTLNGPNGLVEVHHIPALLGDRVDQGGFRRRGAVIGLEADFLHLRARRIEAQRRRHGSLDGAHDLRQEFEVGRAARPDGDVERAGAGLDLADG